MVADQWSVRRVFWWICTLVAHTGLSGNHQQHQRTLRGSPLLPVLSWMGVYSPVPHAPRDNQTSAKEMYGGLPQPDGALAKA